MLIHTCNTEWWLGLKESNISIAAVWMTIKIFKKSMGLWWNGLSANIHSKTVCVFKNSKTQTLTLVLLYILCVGVSSFLLGGSLVVTPLAPTYRRLIIYVSLGGAGYGYLTVGKLITISLFGLIPYKFRFFVFWKIKYFLSTISGMANLYKTCNVWVINETLIQNKKGSISVLFNFLYPVGYAERLGILKCAKIFRPDLKQKAKKGY